MMVTQFLDIQGPVYNKEGKVIWILNAGYYGDLSKYEFNNLSAIIPINRAKIINDEIINNV